MADKGKCVVLSSKITSVSNTLGIYVQFIQSDGSRILVIPDDYNWKTKYKQWPVECKRDAFQWLLISTFCEPWSILPQELSDKILLLIARRQWITRNK